MPPNRTVAVELKALVANYVAGMRQAQTATKQFATSAMKDINASKEQLDDLSSKGLVAGGALVAGVALLTKSYAGFDRQMSAVAATGDDARNALDSLRAAALLAGKDTAFSATEAAEGVENLLKAGVSARDVLSGGLIGSLNLAAAGELSVADAAETAAMALTQFHLEGSDVSHVADLLAAGAGKAQGEVSDLSMALRQSGLVASQFGLNIEDTVGTLSAFANAGLIGSDAGTSLKSMLLQLAGPSGTSAKLMRELGINAYDASGSFVGITNLAEQLQTKLGGLTQAQRDQAMAQIFGNDAVRSANVLYEQGAQGLQQVIDQTNDAGYAARTAATRMDNLAGDWEKFTGSLETAALQSGSGVNAWLRNLTQGATGFADAIGELPTPLLDTVVKLAALTGGGLVATSMLSKLTVNVVGAWGEFQKLRTESPRLASGLGKVGKAAGVVAAAMVALQVASVFGANYQAELDKTKLSLADIAEALGQVSEGDTTKLDEAFRRINQEGSGAAESIAVMNLASKDGLASFLGQADSWIKGLVGIQGNWAANTEQIQKMDQALAAVNPDIAAEAYRRLSDQLSDLGMTQDEIAATFPQYKATLVETANQLDITTLTAEDYAAWMSGEVPAAVEAATAAHPDLVEKLSDTQKAAAGGAQTMDEYAKAVWAAADAVLETSGSQVGFERALDDTASAVDKLAEKAKKAGHFKDLTNVDTQWGRDAIEQLNKLASSTSAYTKDLIENGGSQEEVRLAVARARAEFIDEAEALGYSAEKAEELADARGLIPANINLETTEEGTVAATERLNDLKGAIDDLPKQTQAEIVSEFETNGVDAAYTALHKIDREKAEAWIRSMLDSGGISDWKKYKPEPKKASIIAGVTMNKSADQVVYSIAGHGSLKFLAAADGALFERLLGSITRGFAGGGFGQPQVRPFQGAAGVQWGEEGSGPWEAFISGAPQKRDRSIAIWREVGRRLLGTFSAADLVEGFADGGIAEPTWQGQTLSYWQDQLRSALELTRLQISIRDLKKDLAEKETYYTGKGKKRKKHKRDKLRGLDRTEAEQELAEAQSELALAQKAKQLNESKAGTIEAQIAAWEAQKAAAEKKQEAAEEAATKAANAAADQSVLAASKATSAQAAKQPGATSVGGAEPTWQGQTLSYWKGQLKSDLEISQMQAQVRDLKKDLTDTSLTGLDRTIAQQKLAEAQKQLDESLKAQALNASKAGSIEAQIAAWETKQEAQEAAAKAQQEAQEAAAKAAAEAAEALQQLADTAAANSDQLSSGYMSGSSLADLVANMQSGAQQVAAYQNTLAALQEAGLSSDLVSWLSSEGVGAQDLAQQILASGSGGITLLEAAFGNLTKASDALGMSQATGTYTAAPVLSSVVLPSYMTSGSAGTTTITKAPVFNVTSNDPYGAATIINQQLRYL